ncbi:MAG TPA: hypothetical protein VNQ52_07150 [Microbacteriaceae bacterium]|nr:hypothetical protein [Microbacteriaceae bacterium]
MSENASTPVPDDDDETVIIGADESTVIVSRDATVIVPRGATAPDDVGDAEGVDDEDTVSMSTDHGAPADEDGDDDTVIVMEEADDRPVAVPVDDEATVRVDRTGPDLPTVRVDRGASSGVRPSMVPQQRRRRGELRPAPVPSGFGGVPFVASGAGAVSSYRARTLVPPSAELAAPSASPTAERMLGGVASVRAQSRRASIWAIAAAAASVVVIAGGMLWAIKDLVGF